MSVRRLVGVAAGLAMGITAMTGCGAGDEPSAGDLEGKIEGKVSIQTWALKPKFTDYVEGVIADFEKENPGVEVTWLDQPGDGYDQKVLTQASSGDLPDVTNLPPDFALPLAQQDQLLDLEETDVDLEGTFVEGGLQGYQYDGLDGTYGYPWYLGTDVNYWNKDMLAENGLDPASLPTDLDSLIEQARTLKEKSGGKVYLMTRKPGLNDLQQADVPIFNDEGTELTFNAPEAVELVQKYADAYADGLLPKDILTDTFQGNAELYNQEKAAWTTGSSNISGLEEANPALAKGTEISPAFGDGPLYVQGLSVNANSKNLAAANALAQFVTNPDNQREFAKLAPGVYPSTVASQEDPYFTEDDGSVAAKAKVTGLKTLTTAIPNNPKVSPAMSTIIDQQIGLAISGDATAQEALDNAVEECNKLLAQ